MDFAHLHYADTSYDRALDELLLLADHLATPGWGCSQCMEKHARMAVAFAREATQLTGAAPRHDRLLAQAQGIHARVVAGDTGGIPALVRQIRVGGP